nr:hypothetical protein [Tanacetum cinerariifolium]
SRVIEMDDPAATTDSSGVPSTIERSPLDFSLEARASAQGTVAPEMPPSEDVPVTDVPEAGQAEETATTDPPAALESRKRGRDGTDVNAPSKSLRQDHADPRPDTDPLSVADPPSRHPADVAQSSHGTAAAGDPRSENAYSPVEIGSPESVYRPKWGVVNGSLLDTPEAWQDLVDHVSNECLSQQVSTLQQQVSGEEKLNAAFEEFKRQQDDRVEQRCAEMDARLYALSMDFDEELYPHMLTAIAGRRW